jgi:microcystin-dependent protein
MSEPFIGQICIYGFNFAPRGWAFCNGQILSISQNTALFSLLGTTYGGNGTTTFALPNLQSRVPLHFGQGTGLSAYSLGEVTGSENVTLTQSNLPLHNHSSTTPATAADGNSIDPAAGAVFGAGTSIYKVGAATIQMSPTPTSLTGGSQPVSIIQPLLALNFCIALQGIFPSRN